jgi:hypothetical protein
MQTSRKKKLIPVKNKINKEDVKGRVRGIKKIDPLCIVATEELTFFTKIVFKKEYLFDNLMERKVATPAGKARTPQNKLLWTATKHLTSLNMLIDVGARTPMNKHLCTATKHLASLNMLVDAGATAEDPAVIHEALLHHRI